MCLQVLILLPPQQQLPPLACPLWPSMAATATSSHHLYWLRGRVQWLQIRCRGHRGRQEGAGSGAEDGAARSGAEAARAGQLVLRLT